jgi:hypothetical protein
VQIIFFETFGPVNNEYEDETRMAT